MMALRSNPEAVTTVTRLFTITSLAVITLCLFETHLSVIICGLIARTKYLFLIKIIVNFSIKVNIHKRAC